MFPVNKTPAEDDQMETVMNDPKHQFGPITGIVVGTTWLNHLQASKSGVHRPPVAGIHSLDKIGAFSIVLCGGYEDDVDHGGMFVYTGSGGRKIKNKNKGMVKQTSDQELTRCNRALALNCNAPIDEINGARSLDWKNGKPVRVLRSSKFKHSPFAPKIGLRYDGIYKVVRYYRILGKSGFFVWKYLLKRDDPTDAPWTKKGKERIAELGLQLILPENDEEEISSSKRKRALKE